MKHLVVFVLTFLMSGMLGFAQMYQVNTATTTARIDLYIFNNITLKKEDYTKLKKATVYVVLPNSQLEKLDEYKRLIDSAWTFSKIDVISIEEYDEYRKDEDAAFFMFHYNLVYSKDDRSYGFLNLGYKLIKPNKDPDKSIIYANIDLLLDCKSGIIYNKSFYEKNIKKNTEELNTQLYNKAVMLNFTPQLLSRYLKSISFQLTNKSTIEYNSKNQILSKLTVDTLFLTENCLFSNMGKIDRTNECSYIYRSDKKFMSVYPYPYKLISFEELESKLANNERFFYAMYDSKFGFDLFESGTVDFVYTAKVNSIVGWKKIFRKKMEVLTKDIDLVK